MAFYGMVTTEGSSAYTPHALHSFFGTTELMPTDKFYLIDNDGNFDSDDFSEKLEVIRNETPKSFAQNVNQIMRLAAAARADLFFLNNDLIFTPGWNPPLLVQAPVIFSPVSNREIQYETRSFTFRNVLSLDDYLSHLPEFGELLQTHQARKLSYMNVAMLPFFCVKIPFAIYSVVGSLDERFGRGGGEDNDYCLRTVLAGFKIHYAMQSFVLHFNGRSTWQVENEQETKKRCLTFTSKFKEKWGEKLTRFAIEGDISVIEGPDLQPLLHQGNLREVVRTLAALDGKIF